MKRKSNQHKSSGFNRIFNRIASTVTRGSGSPVAIISALALVILWAGGGFIFGFTDTWQLLINTTTTIITFLMVFVIQQSQNKDTMAIQMKLNELIACNEKASNRLVDIEDLTDQEIVTIKKFYEKLSKLSGSEELHATHSLDEAEDIHEEKSGRMAKKPAKK